MDVETRYVPGGDLLLGDAGRWLLLTDPGDEKVVDDLWTALTSADPVRRVLAVVGRAFPTGVPGLALVLTSAGAQEVVRGTGRVEHDGATGPDRALADPVPGPSRRLTGGVVSASSAAVPRSAGGTAAGGLIDGVPEAILAAKGPDGPPPPRPRVRRPDTADSAARETTEPDPDLVAELAAVAEPHPELEHEQAPAQTGGGQHQDHDGATVFRPDHLVAATPADTVDAVWCPSGPPHRAHAAAVPDLPQPGGPAASAARPASGPRRSPARHRRGGPARPTGGAGSSTAAAAQRRGVAAPGDGPVRARLRLPDAPAPEPGRVEGRRPRPRLARRDDPDRAGPGAGPAGRRAAVRPGTRTTCSPSPTPTRCVTRSVPRSAPRAGDGARERPPHPRLHLRRAPRQRRVRRRLPLRAGLAAAAGGGQGRAPRRPADGPGEVPVRRRGQRDGTAGRPPLHRLGDHGGDHRGGRSALPGDAVLPAARPRGPGTCQPDASDRGGRDRDQAGQRDRDGAPLRDPAPRHQAQQRAGDHVPRACAHRLRDRRPDPGRGGRPRRPDLLPLVPAGDAGRTLQRHRRLRRVLPGRHHLAPAGGPVAVLGAQRRQLDPGAERAHPARGPARPPSARTSRRRWTGCSSSAWRRTPTTGHGPRWTSRAPSSGSRRTPGSRGPRWRSRATGRTPRWPSPSPRGRRSRTTR